MYFSCFKSFSDLQFILVLYNVSDSLLRTEELSTFDIAYPFCLSRKMEVSRMSFGLRSSLHACKVPICLKTKVSLVPQCLLPKKRLSRRQKKHELFCVRATKSASDDDLESSRPLTQFFPSFWGDFFFSFSVDQSVSIHLTHPRVMLQRR